MEKAKELLLTTQYSMLEIALQVGYQNPAAFTRAFAQTVGQPPATFRKDQQSMIWKIFLKFLKIEEGNPNSLENWYEVKQRKPIESRLQKRAGNAEKFSRTLHKILLTFIPTWYTISVRK